MGTSDLKIKNLKIYKRTRKNKLKLVKNKMSLKIIAGILAIALAFSIYIGTNKYKEYIQTQNQTAIVQQYGEYSDESNVFDYIILSEKLHSLGLNDFEISEELMKECEIENNLLTPAEIESLIAQYMENKFYIPSNSLDKDYNRVVLITKLIHQEKLVNQYIYDKGYDYAHDNITKAAKQYVAEVFGVDPSSIIFEYHSPKDDRGATVKINIVSETGNVVNSYFVSGWGDRDIKETIIEAVMNMDRTDKHFDEDNNDNNLYNKTRNSRIMNALTLSSKLFSEVNNNNLYNEKLNDDLMNKSK